MITTTFPALCEKSQDQRVKIPVQITLTFDPDFNPLSVQCIIAQPGTGEEDAVWNFSRELLLNGVNSYRPVGWGDVKFRYEGNRNGHSDGLLMCLRNHVGQHADLRLPHHKVVNFLNETVQAVRPGTECLEDEVDQLIEGILGS